MATYLDMITRIQDDFVNESITVAQIKNAIKSSIALYSNSEFYFNQKSVSFNTIANDELYDSSDLADIASLTRIISATVGPYKAPLDAVDYGVIDENQTGAMVGLPYWFAYFGQKIRLYPMPDAVYTVNLSMYYKFTDLSADADTNAWMNDGEELIRQSAKRRLALDILHSTDMAARCKSLEDEALDGLQSESRQRLSNHKLRIPAMQSHRSFNILTGV